MFKSTLSAFSFFFILNTIFFLPTNSLGQIDHRDPAFESFKGTVYQMPKMMLKKGGQLTKTILERYDEKVYTYDSLTTISLESIDIPETLIQGDKFPGVSLSTKFCMLLHSKMTIKEDGMYEFVLNSDDGSILWINEEEVVNNDGGHPMQMTIETVPLYAGTYPVRLWYFQGHPDRFGLQFDASYRGPIPTSEPIELAIPSDLLFDINESSLSSGAQGSLDKLISKMNLDALSFIEIIGYTDGIGEPEDNLKLSNQRAQSVAEYIAKAYEGNNPIMKVSGRGESDPIASNDTTVGRVRNRRVQIRYY